MDIQGSDSEFEDSGNEQHEELLTAITSLSRKKRKLAQRSEPAVSVSEHYLDTTSLGNVNVGDLLKGIKSSSLGPLSKRLTAVQEKRALATPLSRVKTDQIQRSIAYEESCKQTGKWAPIVKKNREAEHLSFPLQEDQVPLPSLTTKVESYKPQNDFEREIANVLANSDNVQENGEELTKAEKQALVSLSLEEAAERRNELKKMRALMSYYEAKARRTKKIKSKKFHRILRKKKDAKLSHETGDSEDLTDKAERLRAEERMTLKHSRMSKWAKQQLSRAHKDNETKEALADLHSKGQALKQKMVQESNSECESEHSQHSADEEESPVQATHMPSTSNPWLGTSSASSEKIPSKHRTVITTHSTMLSSSHSPDQDLSNNTAQLLVVQEAFAGDDVVKEFQEEKQKLIDDSKAKTVDLTLPGWGSWGGKGAKPVKKSRRIIKTIPERPRKDAGIRNVIISETKDKKVSKHLVKEVPWPYTSEEQFDKTHAAPVGRHWNTEATFNTAIRPRVTTGIGRVIEPIKLTEDVQEFMKRTRRKKTVASKSRKTLKS